MHDVIHGMSRLVSSNTCFCLEDQGSKYHPPLKNARRLSLSQEHLHSVVLSATGPKLRTLLVVSRDGSRLLPQVSYELFLKLQFLRVLDLGIGELPNTTDHLKHLHYLNLSENHIQKLPESITTLLCLQTLKLKNCIHFLGLPKNFKNLPCYDILTWM